LQCSIINSSAAVTSRYSLSFSITVRSATASLHRGPEPLARFISCIRWPAWGRGFWPLVWQRKSRSNRKDLFAFSKKFTNWKILIDLENTSG
jgi:hypothetical protein